jgi:hypothetical protein
LGQKDAKAFETSMGGPVCVDGEDRYTPPLDFREIGD